MTVTKFLGVKIKHGFLTAGALVPLIPLCFQRSTVISNMNDQVQVMLSILKDAKMNKFIIIKCEK